MTKHTPGPWTAREPNGPGNGWSVGPAWLGGKPWSDETSANAHLIAAAPDMLAALEAIAPMLPRAATTATWGDPVWTDAGKVEVAIAKARSENP